MSKLYAIRQTKFEKYWYDFVEDFTSAELNRDCISNNLTYVKECQNNLETLNSAWKNSEIVEFRELGKKDDFEDLYYKSLEQRAFLEKQLAEKDAELKNLVLVHFESATNKPVLTTTQIINQEKIEFAIQKLEEVKDYNYTLVFSSSIINDFINNQIEELKKEIT